MVKIAWKLTDYLKAHGLQPQDVEKAAIRLGQPLGKNTIYRVLRGEGPSRIDRNTLSALVGALGELTHQKVEPSDLLEFVEQTTTGLKLLEPESRGSLGMGKRRKKLPARAKASEVLIAEMRGSGG
jgi:hypothetical protein